MGSQSNELAGLAGIIKKAEQEAQRHQTKRTTLEDHFKMWMNILVPLTKEDVAALRLAQEKIQGLQENDHTPAASQLETTALELCARLHEQYRFAGHPCCPDPDCGNLDGEHTADCAYIKYAEAYDDTQQPQPPAGRKPNTKAA